MKTVAFDFEYISYNYILHICTYKKITMENRILFIGLNYFYWAPVNYNEKHKTEKIEWKIVNAEF